MSANDPFFTFLVITEPAPTILFCSIVTGATSDEFDPIKALSLIAVSYTHLTLPTNREV